MNKPFLSIVTRCHRRPVMLEKNIHSVAMQTDKDIEQVFLVDFVGRGLLWANKQLFEHRDKAVGDYIYILDDDCLLICPEFVELLKETAKTKPSVIMVRSKRPQLAPKLLPRDNIWGHRERLPMKANCLCYVVEHKFWQENIAGFAGRAGAGLFMKRLVKTVATFAWLDIVAAETQQLGRGRKFEECNQSWWHKIVSEFDVEEVAKNDWRLRYWRNK